MFATPPRVGIGVYIFHKGRVLMGHRIKEHGRGYWAPPGGHLEPGESFEDCAAREAMEETGLVLRDIRLYTVTNDLFAESGKHYITVQMIAEVDSDQIHNREPDKHKDWQWFAWDALPQPLFLSVSNMLAQGLVPPCFAEVACKSAVQTWLDEMCRVWMSKIPDGIAPLLAEKLEYYETPFDPPLTSADEVVAAWQEIKHQNIHTISIELIHETPDGAGVALWRFKQQGQPEHRGLYFLKLDVEGKCEYFRQFWNRESL